MERQDGPLFKSGSNVESEDVAHTQSKRGRRSTHSARLASQASAEVGEAANWLGFDCDGSAGLG